MTKDDDHDGRTENNQDYQHLYTARQTPKPILQDTGQFPAPFNPLLQNKAVARLDETLKHLKAIRDGKRPMLPPSRAARNLQSWLDKIDLLQPASDYYKIPEQDIVLGHNPALHKIFERVSKLEATLKPLGINACVLGVGRGVSEAKIKMAQRNSDVLIALPGDMKAGYEMIDIIRNKMTPGIKLPPLIIENSDKSYDDLLSSLQLMEIKSNPRDHEESRTFLNMEGLADHFGIYITQTQDETVQLTKDLVEKRRKTEGIVRPQELSQPPLIPEGATIFVATGTRKKYNEVRRIYERQGLKINILPIDFLVESYVSPDEDQNSYEGNAAKKLEAAFDAWKKTPDQEERLANIGKRLHDMGRRKDGAPLKKEDIFIISEDSGFHFVQADPKTNKNISTHPLFADIGRKINPNAPFPGVETGPGILGNYGVNNFFRTAGKILALYKDKGYNTTHDVVSRSVIALGQLQPPEQEIDGHAGDNNRQIIMYGGETKGRFNNVPFPDNGSLEIGNFLVPGGHETTEVALGDDWILTGSPRALAWNGLVCDQKIAKDATLVRPPLREKDFHIGIVSDKSHEVARKAIERLVALNRLPEFKVDQIDGEIARISDVQSKMLEGYDATVLAFDPERANIDFWRNVWTFSSLVVGEQTRDKYKLEKPLYLINPKLPGQEGPFDYLEKLTHDLHLLGTIPQDPKTLYKSVGSVDQAVELLKKDREDYLRYDPPQYSKGPAFKPIGVESNKDFNVAIFLSATNENDNTYNVSRELTTKLVSQGFGIITGAGLNGGMGTITKTIIKLKGQGIDAWHGGQTVPHIADGGEVGGKNISEMLDRFQMSRDIYERIEGLLQADAAIIAPGGMGTIQELAGFAMLKQMALDHPEDEELQKFKDKELVILNTIIPVTGESRVGSKPRGFYSVLKEIIPKQECERLGIHIKDSVEEAIKEMQDLRTKKRASTGKGDHRPAAGESRPAMH